MLPTATPPPYGQLITLSSGNAFLVEYTFSLGELWVGATIALVIGFIGLTWLYELANGRRRPNGD